MSSSTPDELRQKLGTLGVDEVRRQRAHGVFTGWKLDEVDNWLRDQETALDAPTYMYHPELAPDGQIFKAREVEVLKENGWYDSPNFPAPPKPPKQPWLRRQWQALLDPDHRGRLFGALGILGAVFVFFWSLD